MYDSISKGNYIINAKRLENLLEVSTNAARCLTHATLQINTFSRQLVNIIATLWNVQSFKIIYYHNKFNNPGGSNSQPDNRVQLDLSGVGHLREFELDVKALISDSYRHVFFNLQKSQYNVEKTPPYYEYEDVTKDGSLGLISTHQST